MYSPHHCVGFLFFAWIPPLLLLRPSAAPPSQLITAPLLTPHLSQHNSSTSITSLITAQLITAPLLTPHLSHLHFSHHLSHHHSSQLHFSHLLLTPHLSHPRLSHHHSHHHSSQLHFSHLTHHIITAQLITAPWSADCLSRGRCSAAAFRVHQQGLTGFIAGTGLISIARHVAFH